ncbi:MAG: hypothetical protein MSH08_00905 [Ezakiella sp.]|nr:hypothetical protein [Ezakiella sp.]MDD7471318.1 hypothetical protein [Bacillota bacterium]MDY3923587.1 hypothetical protein [Ezakiella sp.]
MEISEVLEGKVVFLDESVLIAPGIDDFLEKILDEMIDLGQKFYITKETYSDLEKKELEGVSEAGDAITLIEDLINQNLVGILIAKNKDGIIKLTEISQERPILYITMDKKTALNLEMFNRMKSYSGKPISVMGINKLGDLIPYNK